jgi:hypothetical protein
MLHASGTRLVSRLKAVVAGGDAPSTAVDLPPQCYSWEGKVELIRVIGYLEELLDCLADDIVAEISQIQRCWDRYYGEHTVSTATALIDWLSRAFKDATALDRAIYGEHSRLIGNYRAFTDEIDWLLGFRACSPHSHAVPYLHWSLNRFRDEMVSARDDECEDEESFKAILEGMWSKLDAFQASKREYGAWVDKTRLRTNALRMALTEGAARAVHQAADEQRMPANSLRASGLAPEVHNRINKRSEVIEPATALVAVARGLRRLGRLTSPAH